VPVLRLGLSGEQVVRALQAHPAAQYIVTSGEDGTDGTDGTDGGDVVGVLRVGDVAAVLEPKRPRPAR
jgi:hypothetical protein